MSMYIALLRGINVGGRNVLPMRELVRDLQSLNCKDVRTYIQSGNAVFRCCGWQEHVDDETAQQLGRRGFEG